MDYREVDNEFTKVQKGKKQAREQQKVEAEELATKEAEQRSSESLVKQNVVTSYLSNLSSEELHTVQNLCYQSVISSNPLFKKAYEQKGFDHIVTQKVFSDFVFEYMNK